MEKPDLAKKKVLVVEDEERNWFVLRDIIQICNGEAYWVESGIDAIKLIEEDKEIALVFMDIRLPFMSGVEATKRIKAHNPDLPVIIQTAFAEREELLKYKNAGADDCIFKPINLKQVMSLLSAYVLGG